LEYELNSQFSREEFWQTSTRAFNSYTKPFNHRFSHAQYHFQEIERLLKESINEKLAEKDLIKILFSRY